jgi:uncharacterized protein YodC (DUF2158 family)
MSKFKVGDVVILRSGGPAMTVTKVTSDAIVCEWFDNKQSAQIKHFVPDAIDIYTTPSLGISLG